MGEDLNRLTRIERKLDQLAELMSDLARLDERADAIEVRVNRHELRLDIIENQTNRHSQSIAKNEGKGLLIERAARILFAAVVSSISHFF